MIKLINGYFIDADNYNFVLKEKVTRTNRKDNSTYEAETTIGYFDNIPVLIQSCVKNCIKEKVASSDITTLADCITEMKNINTELNNMINPLDVHNMESKFKK